MLNCCTYFSPNRLDRSGLFWDWTLRPSNASLVSSVFSDRKGVLFATLPNKLYLFSLLLILLLIVPLWTFNMPVWYIRSKIQLLIYFFFLFEYCMCWPWIEFARHFHSWKVYTLLNAFHFSKTIAYIVTSCVNTHLNAPNQQTGKTSALHLQMIN